MAIKYIYREGSAFARQSMTKDGYVEYIREKRAEIEENAKNGSTTVPAGFYRYRYHLV